MSHNGPGKPWTEEETARFKQAWPTVKTYEELFIMFPGRTLAAMRAWGFKLGLTRQVLRFGWSDADVRRLRELWYSTTTMEELLAAFPARTLYAVHKKAELLGFCNPSHRELLYRGPLPSEEWRQVSRRGGYEVSNKGRIRTVASESPFVWRLVHLSPDSSGYPRFYVCEGKRTEFFLVHHCVAEAFIGPRPAGMVVNHKDAVKFNNNADNLEYATKSEDVLHAMGLGLHPHRQVMTPDKDREVVELRAVGYKPLDIATTLGVSVSSVFRAIRRHREKMSEGTQCEALCSTARRTLTRGGHRRTPSAERQTAP